MDAAATAAAWVLIALAMAYWGTGIRSGPLRTRLWSLLARKPHTTRRAYTMRMLVYQLEVALVQAPAVVAMVATPLSMVYADAPDTAAMVVIFTTFLVAIATCAIMDKRIARRAGLICPACKAQLGDPPRHPGLFLLTGRCVLCNYAVFPVPLGMWNPQPLPPHDDVLRRLRNKWRQVSE
jgi:hypothetical protein